MTNYSMADSKHGNEQPWIKKIDITVQMPTQPFHRFELTSEPRHQKKHRQRTIKKRFDRVRVSLSNHIEKSPIAAVSAYMTDEEL